MSGFFGDGTEEVETEVPDSNKEKKTNANSISDEELLREIQEEMQKEEELNEKIRIEMIKNGTLPNSTIENNSWRNNETNAQQLTQFQETIITTGSEVSIFLLVILAILFIFQAVRKMYKAYVTSRAVEKVESVLGEAEATRAENITHLDFVGDKQYPVYNTNFTFYEDYAKKKAEGASLVVLKDLLLKRAVAVVQRIATLKRDGQGIRKNWQQDLLPKDVWDDFQGAQVSVNQEAESIINENKHYNFKWAPFDSNIFEKANQIFSQKMKNKQIKLHQALYGNKNQNMGPSPNQFGSGFKGGFLNNDSSKNKKKNQNQSQNQNRNIRGRHHRKLTKNQQKLLEQQNNDNDQHMRKRKPRKRFGKN